MNQLMHDVIDAPPLPKPRKGRSGFPLFKAILGVIALVIVFVVVKFFQIKKMISMKPPMPVTTVSSATVEEQDWPPIFSSVGSISPVQGAIVSTELAGVVAEIKFDNGGVAKKGDVLMRLDASSEEAQLHSAEADLELARQDVARARELAGRQVVSKAELDSAESKLKQKEGAVDNMRSMITKKEVRAPFDGQLGIRQVNVGQMIKAGDQVVPLQALNPLYVDFALPQQDLQNLAPGLEVRVRTDALPDHEFHGKLTSINSMVDSVTRNVMVQATLENQDHALRPGMFVRVEVMLPQKEPALVIPGSAVSYAPYGDSVYVIEKKKDEKTGQESLVLRQQFVRVGEARGDFVSITKGLEKGQQVVSAGVFKLRNGIPVVINNDLAPKPEVNPKPADT
ncbi:MAG: efflux RND transporter periplasmic adaptor subunit [Chthoniobacterales bacterium]